MHKEEARGNPVRIVLFQSLHTVDLLSTACQGMRHTAVE